MSMKPCPETFPYPLIVLDETDSTNRYISQLCNELQESVAELTTVTAEFQTAGKGQRGNTWEAERGKNLLFSFVLYPTFLEARRQFILSQIVSLSIKEELDRWSDEITIKWPNDIYWRDKKICGILIENDLSGHFIGRSISGIGININQNEFHSDAPNPVSLKQITGQEHDRYEILSHMLKRVQRFANGRQRYLYRRNSRPLCPLPIPPQRFSPLRRCRRQILCPPAACGARRTFCPGRRERQGTGIFI